MSKQTSKAKYKVFQDGDQHCVHLLNDDGSKGAVVEDACYDDPEDAQKSMSDLMLSATQERDMRPNVGGGVDADKLDASDFVFSDERKFPIVTAQDVSDAVSSWGRYQGKHSFDDFKTRLLALAKRKGFASALPDDWKSADKQENATGSAVLPLRPIKTTVLSETLDFSEATLDPQGHVIRGVVLIRSGLSKNKRRYGESTLQAAVPIFEGAKAYANHPRAADQRDGRSMRDLTGWYEGVRYASGALVADRHFLDTAAGRDAWAIAEAIVSQRAPATLAGLSINAAGQGRMVKNEAGGEFLDVESITYAYSVDDVDEPAAGGSYRLTASGGGDALAEALLAVLTFDEWTAGQPAYVERLKNQWKSVRLDEATKTALAEADREVKTARAEAETLRETVESLQQDIQALSQARDTAFALATGKARELAIERALGKTRLPAPYKEDLRKRLPAAAEADWAGMIEVELTKAQRSGGLTRVPVSGAGVQESRMVEREELLEEALLPRDHEDAAQWQRRIAALNVTRRTP